MLIIITCFAGTYAFAGDSTESSDFRTEYKIYTASIQQLMDECIGEQYSTIAIVDCQHQELDQLDGELNRVYKILMKRMNQQSKETLRAPQRIGLNTVMQNMRL